MANRGEVSGGIPVATALIAQDGGGVEARHEHHERAVVHDGDAPGFQVLTHGGQVLIVLGLPREVIVGEQYVQTVVGGVEASQ